jgi:hypothetical protein
MGGWLRGDRNPPVSQTIRPGLAEYYARIGALDNLQAKRPVGPALHAAISEALTNFAMRIAPGIVSCHKGELICAGGDDVLALLPTETAIAALKTSSEPFECRTVRSVRVSIASDLHARPRSRRVHIGVRDRPSAAGTEYHMSCRHHQTARRGLRRGPQDQHIPLRAVSQLSAARPRLSKAEWRGPAAFGLLRSSAPACA